MSTTRPLPWRPSQTGDQPASPHGRRRRWLRRAVIALTSVIVLLCVLAGALWLVTPSASEATALAAAQAKERGIAYPGPPAPANFTRPLIATEDHRFDSEPGVDPVAVARVVQNWLSGGAFKGGATLEQQLAKLLYTPGEDGFDAEVKQVVLAFKLNLAYSKQQILDLYAEVNYYGHGYYGLEAASCGYFGHPAKDLTVSQGAMLAGVVNAPSVDDPVDHPAAARTRLEHVIGRMVAVGDLTKAQGRQALDTPLGLTPGHSPHC